MKRNQIGFSLIALALVGGASIYTKLALDEKFSVTTDDVCRSFEKEITSVSDIIGLKFSGSDNYRSRYYSKFAINYSDEYGLGKDISCYYESDVEKIAVYFREGFSDKTIIGNQEYFAFFIDTPVANRDDYAVHWKLP